MTAESGLEPHRIKELLPGVFWTLLDFPPASILGPLLSSTVPYVLCWGHHVSGQKYWTDFSLPLVDPLQPEPVLARYIELDFIVPTERFHELLPNLRRVSAVQLAALPPAFFDPHKIQGKELWRVLAEIGWHVWADIPGNDYGQVASRDREVVEQAIALVTASNRESGR